jgi:uncharacterized protein (TIRG00374 family)
VSKEFLKWLRIIGVSLFIWIALQIDWRSVWNLLKDIQPYYILSYIIIVVILVLLKVVRLRWFLASVGYKLNFKEIYQSVVEPSFYGIVTPARLGELSKVLYLARLGLSQKQAWSVVILERMIDLFVLLIATISGSLFYFVWDGKQVFWPASLFFVLSGLLYYGLRMSSNLVETILKKSKRIWFGGAHYEGEYANEVGHYLTMSAKILLPFTFLILALSILSMWLLGLSLGVSVSGFYLGLAYAAGSIISLIPITFAGLGSREAIYIMILDKEGIASSTAITISLLEGVVLAILIQGMLMLPLIKEPRDG